MSDPPTTDQDKNNDETPQSLSWPSFVLQERGNRIFLLSFSVVVLTLTCLLLCFYSRYQTKLTASPAIKTKKTTTTTATGTETFSVPFIVLHGNSSSNNNNAPDWRVLDKALERFRQDQQAALQQLSRNLQVTLQAESELFTGNNTPILSTRLENRIHTLAALYEHDMSILQRQILVPFSITKALPSSASRTTATYSHDEKNESYDERNDNVLAANITAHINNKPTNTSRRRTSDDDTNHEPSHHFTFYCNAQRSRTAAPDDYSSAAVYDSVGQVLAHLVRDWSSDGIAVRQALYGWCVDRLRHYSPPIKLSPSTSLKSSATRVLIPGAGLGRLAWQVAQEAEQQHHVHAVEASWVMAAAAASLLQSSRSTRTSTRTTPKHCFTLHPYANDFFTNEVDSSLRYQPVLIPDVHIQGNASSRSAGGSSSLSYTIGDFCEIARMFPNYYHAVVTSFFLDTATNVYKYILSIYSCLQPNGIWINVGPLQWHRNAVVQLSADDLKLLLQHGFGFTILEWSVDEQPIAYRNSDANVRSTHYDAYCPLRFVVQK